MKKTLLLLIISVFLFISCRADITDNSNQNGNKINPPSWIIGKWKLDSDINSFYTFKQGDIIIESLGMSTSLKTTADLGGYSQTSSDTEFTYTLTMQSYSQTYKFKKITNTQIKGDLGLGGDYVAIYNKQ